MIGAKRYIGLYWTNHPEYDCQIFARWYDFSLLNTEHCTKHNMLSPCGEEGGGGILPNKNKPPFQE